jgi:hypothetical protein
MLLVPTDEKPLSTSVVGQVRFPARTRSRAVLDSQIGTTLPAAPSPIAGMLL